ncbi:KpsF/GutQ family sugar-phosphate isomerase [Deltaproteobacteria bacterium TL4]
MTTVLERAKQTLSLEIEGIQNLINNLDSSFEDAVEHLLACKGKVIITGVGKSGIIGKKIAATLTSTGTPSLFMHAADSAHGDLGILEARDVVIAISNSGETAEVISILGHIQAIGIPLIGISGNPKSSLARNSTVHLNIAVDKEACPLGLAPTTSSTVTLALGDALAMCLLEKRNFNAEDFGLFHPGGSLGKKLSINVNDVMITGEALPLLQEETSMQAALQFMLDKHLGILIIVDSEQRLKGVFSMGDYLRLINRQTDFFTLPIANFMIQNPKVITKDVLAAKALHLMETRSITCLVVVNEKQNPIGIVQIYHILRAGVY